LPAENSSPQLSLFQEEKIPENEIQIDVEQETEQPLTKPALVELTSEKNIEIGLETFTVNVDSWSVLEPEKPITSGKKTETEKTQWKDFRERKELALKIHKVQEEEEIRKKKEKEIKEQEEYEKRQKEVAELIAQQEKLKREEEERKKAEEEQKQQELLRKREAERAKRTAQSSLNLLQQKEMMDSFQLGGIPF